MPTLKYLGETFECTTAIKGSDYIHLLDENGVMVAAFDAISDFSGFTLENGSYTSPTEDHSCAVAVIRDDGTIGKGSHSCEDIGAALNEALAAGNMAKTAKILADELSRFDGGLGNEYVWEKSLCSIVTTGGTLSRTTGGAWIQYSSTARVSNGSIELVNPARVLLSGSTVASTQLADKYFYFEDSYDGTVLKCYTATASGTNANVTYYKTTFEKDPTSVSYVNGPDANAYPVDDGYAYEALGRIGNKVQIATGTYIGTGTGGSGNPTSLTFGFVPKLVIVYTGILEGWSSLSLGMFFPAMLTASYQQATYFFGNQTYSWKNREECYAKISETTLSWYDRDGAFFQFNDQNAPCHYIAIG